MAHRQSFVRLLRIASFTLAALAAGSSTRALAQTQTSDQQGCIVALNRAAAAIAAEQRLQVFGCIANAQAGILPLGVTLEECIGTPGAKLAQLIGAATDAQLRSCRTTPDFGYTDASDIVDVVLDQELQLAGEIFGYATGDAIGMGTDRSVSRCQAAVAKDYRRLAAERFRTFIDCKTTGLRNGKITSAEELQACFSSVQTDTEGRINKAFLKMAKDVVKRCPAVDYPSAFPGACADSTDFLSCVQERIACRTCLAINATDDLKEPCDLLDNGEVDRSCIDTRANECAGENGGNNCNVNATCTDETFGFSCHCNAGWHGDGVKCVDDNECHGQGSGNDCSINATCTNTVGSFTCACKPGYHGDGVTCTDDNECTGQGTGNNCSANATCINLPGTFQCACNVGYTGNGVTCTDVNECLGEGLGNNCSSDAHCTNTIGSFTCACNAGFGGDGVNCLDLNECIGENGGNNCNAHATCTNLPGTFSCACNSGYAGTGVLCSDQNECAGEGSGNNCNAHATCTNTPGSFLCACNAGYTGNGVTCTDLNECFGQGGGNNCSVNAVCTNLPGTFSCACAPGYDGNPVGGTCNPIGVSLTSPTHGSFTTASTSTVTGTVTANPISSVTLTINGATVPINPNGTFSYNLTLTPSLIFNPIRAEVTQTGSGFKVRDRRVVIWGNSVAMGGLMSQGVGLRITDSGFSKFANILKQGVHLDLGTLIPPNTPVISNYCFQDTFLGCAGSATAKIINATSDGFGVAVDSQSNLVTGDVNIGNGTSSSGIVVNIDLTTVILGISAHCDHLAIKANKVDVIADYTLEPVQPHVSPDIDVNLASANNVVWTNYQKDQNCGGIGLQDLLIDLFVGDAKDIVTNGILDFLKDPDGAGPQDSPIAQAIEDALAGIVIAGPLGQAFGVNLATPLFAVPEDVNGVTLGSDATMTALSQAPGAPVFTRTLLVNSTFPQSTLAQATSFKTHSAYGIALAINDSGFNQILAAQVMNGLLTAEIDTIPIPPTNTPTPITPGLLSLFLPEFGQLNPDLPLRAKLTPTLAPVLTGESGPNGELAKLKVSQLQVQIVSGPTNSPTVWATLDADLNSTFDMTATGGALVPALGAVTADDITITLTTNPLGISEASVQALVPQLLLPLVPSLGSALGSFPVPSFLGLTPTPVDISRIGTSGFMGVYMQVQ